MESFKSLLVNNSLFITKLLRLVVVRHLLGTLSKIGHPVVMMSQSSGGDGQRKKEREVQREKRNIKVPNR